MSESELDGMLDGADDNRRSFLKKAVIGGAFVVPIVTSFSMDGLAITSASAAGSNLSGSNVTQP
jgi:hypothetical protein